MAVVDEPGPLVQLAHVRPLGGQAVHPGAGSTPSACQWSAVPQDASRSRQASIRAPAASSESSQWFAGGQNSSQLSSELPR